MKIIGKDSEGVCAAGPLDTIEERDYGEVEYQVRVSHPRWCE